MYPYNIRVYITSSYDLVTSIMYLRQMPGLTLTFTFYLNKTKHRKQVTCHYQLLTHSAWSYHRCLLMHMFLCTFFSTALTRCALLCTLKMFIIYHHYYFDDVWEFKNEWKYTNTTEHIKTTKCSIIWGLILSNLWKSSAANSDSKSNQVKYERIKSSQLMF